MIGAEAINKTKEATRQIMNNVTDTQNYKEFRVKNSSTALNYIQRFSSTEKVIFGTLFILALLTTLSMAYKANDFFRVEVPAIGGELREGAIGLPRAINPVLAITEIDRDISALVYAGLTKYQNDTIAPDIAKSWKISDDGLTYDFVLRDDVIFSNGEPVTAADVAFTIQKIQDPAIKSPRRADWANITVSEISPTQIRFALKQPYAPFVTNTTIGIIPKNIWSTVSDDQFIFSQYNVEPIGAGPYDLSDITRDKSGIHTAYHLETRRDYHGKTPHVGTISFIFFADQEKALAALDEGLIDSLSLISPESAKRLPTDTAQPYPVIPAPLPRVFGVFFNQNQAVVLAEKSVRQALDKAIDRTKIIQTVLSGYGTPITGPFSATEHQKTSSSTALADIAMARTILEKNGWKRNPDGIYEKKSRNTTQVLSFDIQTADTPELRQTAELVKQAWNEMGAQVNVKIFESGDLYQNIIRTRKYDALLFGELVGKDRDLYAFWHSSQRNAPGLNVAQYVNTTVDTLLETIRSARDLGARNLAYEQFDRIIRSDLPAVFLYSPDFIYIVPRSLYGIKLGSISTASDRWNSISDWYIKTEKVWRFFTKI